MTGNVIFDDGSHGVLIQDTQTRIHNELVTIQLNNGLKVSVPQLKLIQQVEGNYFVSALPTDFLDVTTSETIVVPVVAENITIEKLNVETGKLHVVKSSEEHMETVDEPLTRTDYEMRRVPVNQFVDSPPPVRYEGNVMIIPVLEEVLVVEKKLRLKEEVHVIQQQTEYHNPQTVTLRTEIVTAERVDIQNQ